MRRFGVVCLTLFLTVSLSAQRPTSKSWTDSLVRLYEDYIPRLLSRAYIPAREHRSYILRDCQRRGYSNMLMDITQRDGFGALLSYLKLKLQLDYSIDRSPIVYRMRGGPQLIVPLDWSFPVDPWKRNETDITK
ncbi:MAG: hypothetical protein ABSF91_11975 [Bacteroidota bacterium]